MKKNKYNFIPIDYEPKKDCRFKIILPENYEIEEWICKSIELPSYSFLNNSWNPIKITFMDLIGPSTSQKLGRILDDYKKSEKIIEEKTITIVILDPVGAEISEWLIKFDKIIEIGFGNSFDYSSDDIMKPYMVIQPSDCILKY